MITEIDLGMRHSVDGIRNQYQHHSSSHAFASLYVWRKDMDLSIILEEDFFAVKYGLKGDNAWFFPCGNPEKIILFIQNLLTQNKFTLSFIRQEDVEFLQTHFPNVFDITAVEADYEYLYDTKEEVELKGKKFARLRNDLNRLLRLHEVDSVVIDDDNLSLAISVCEKCSTRERFTPSGLSDAYAKRQLLNHYKELNALGILTYLNGVPSAVTMGFPLDDTMFDICLSEQTERVSGLLVYARTELMKLVQDRYPIINAEEDLGLEGLKLMKNIMRPIGFIEMYEVNFSENCCKN